MRFWERVVIVWLFAIGFVTVLHGQAPLPTPGNGIHFSSEVSLGAMVGVGSIIVTLITLHRQNIKRLELINFRVALIWKWYKREHGMNGGPDEYDEA